MYKTKIAHIVLTTVLIISCILLNLRVNELENRIGVVENDQTLIVNNMKKSVDLMKDIADRVAR